MNKMKAVVYDKKASPYRLVYCDVEKPEQKDDEVLIKVKAVSLNAADYRPMKLGIIPKRRSLEPTWQAASSLSARASPNLNPAMKSWGISHSLDMEV
jgi:hypothetical protein